MPTSFLPFSRPSINEDDLQAVRDVLCSGWITTGKVCARLEDEVSSLVAPSQAVALTSATAGMHLALTSLGIGPGDEVITPSMTWVSTVNLITLMGATPVFADIDRDSLMVTADTLAPCITEKTRLIIPVHFAGASADMDPIRSLAADRNITLMEDAAHAIGTRYKKRPIGSEGTAIFSLHPIKNITSGEGGILVSPDTKLTEHIRRLRFHGLGVDAYDRHTQGRSPQAQVLEPGFKYNLPDMCAALGLSQFRRLETLNDLRRQRAEQYLELLQDVDELRPLKTDFDYEQTHAWHLFIVRLGKNRPGLDRDAFMEALKERGIGSGLHFKAVHLHQYYQKTLGLTLGTLPHTEYNSERILSLPLFPDMTEEDVCKVVTTAKEILA